MCIRSKRPQDRVNLQNLSKEFTNSLEEHEKGNEQASNKLKHGDVCLAAITSCTNTSNPSVLIMAGLIAKKAVKLGMKVPWWVKTSFAPGSKVVDEYLKESDLIEPLNKLGFNIVGYGCTTCIGNSGPLDDQVSNEIEKNNLNVCSVISGNRNFEGRIHPLIKSNFLASPPLVVIFALAGKVDIDFEKNPVNIIDGKEIFFNELWPQKNEVENILEKTLKSEFYKKNYSTIFKGDEEWEKLNVKESSTYEWSLSFNIYKKATFPR